MDAATAVWFTCESTLLRTHVLQAVTNGAGLLYFVSNKLEHAASLLCAASTRCFTSVSAPFARTRVHVREYV